MSEPKEKVVLTKITEDMTDEEIDKLVDNALDEILGPEDEADKEDKEEQC